MVQDLKGFCNNDKYDNKRVFYWETNIFRKHRKVECDQDTVKVAEAENQRPQFQFELHLACQHR